MIKQPNIDDLLSKELAELSFDDVIMLKYNGFINYNYATKHDMHGTIVILFNTSLEFKNSWC